MMLKHTIQKTPRAPRSRPAPMGHSMFQKTISSAVVTNRGYSRMGYGLSRLSRLGCVNTGVN